MFTINSNAVVAGGAYQLLYTFYEEMWIKYVNINSEADNNWLAPDDKMCIAAVVLWIHEKSV